MKTKIAIAIAAAAVMAMASGAQAKECKKIGAAGSGLTQGIAGVLRQFRPDVVHAWNVHSHLSYDALRLAKRAGARVVLTYQDVQPFCYSKFKCWVDPEAPVPEHPDYRADPRTCRSCRQHYWMLPPRARLVRTWLGR